MLPIEAILSSRIPSIVSKRAIESGAVLFLGAGIAGEGVFTGGFRDSRVTLFCGIESRARGLLEED